MKDSLFQQAKKQMQQMMHSGRQATHEDKELTNHAIQAAYAEATPEETQELEKLEQQLKQNQLL